MVSNIVSDVLFHYCLCTLISTSKTIQSCSKCLSRLVGQVQFSSTFPSLQSCRLIWMELFGVEIPIFWDWDDYGLYFSGWQDKNIIYLLSPQTPLMAPILWILNAPSDSFLRTAFGKAPTGKNQRGPCSLHALLCSSKRNPWFADVIILLELDIICDLQPIWLKCVPVFKSKAICFPSLFGWMQAV